MRREAKKLGERQDGLATDIQEVGASTADKIEELGEGNVDRWTNMERGMKSRDQDARACLEGMKELLQVEVRQRSNQTEGTNGQLTVQPPSEPYR